MKIFISNSGKLSHRIALTLSKYLPMIIQQVTTFVSSENIQKGDVWINKIRDELNKSDFGIICLTKENLNAPWILFESGALSNKISNSNVGTILFDGLKPPKVKGPLEQFQHTKYEKRDFEKLIDTINNKLGRKKLSPQVLKSTFEQWWPGLESQLNNEIEEVHKEKQPEQEDNETTIKRILNLTEFISDAIERLALPLGEFDLAKFIEFTELKYLGNEWNHPVRLRVFPFLEKGMHKMITITKKSCKIEKFDVTSYDSRGVTIEILFYQEVDSYFLVSFTFHKGVTYFQTKKPVLTAKEKKEYDFTPIWRN